MDKSFTIQNAKRIAEGLGTDNPKFTYLNSVCRHDCQSHKLSNGDVVMVDGGNSFADGGYYGRETAFTAPHGTVVENYSLNEKSTFEEICDKLLYPTGVRVFYNQDRGYKLFADASIDELKLLLEGHGPTLIPLQRAVAYYWKEKKEADLF